MRLLPLLLCVALASATTYWVAKTGNDGNPGTEAEPWLTVTYAEAQTTTGDTVQVKVGVYDEDVDFSTSPGVTFHAYDSHNVVLWGSQFANQPGCVIDGFALTLPDMAHAIQAIRLDADSITVKNCYMKPDIAYQDTSSCGILVGSGGHRDIVIDHNTVDSFGAGEHGHGIYTNEVIHAEITYNTVRANQRYGIQVYPTVESCEIAYNVVKDNLDESGILVEGNHNRVHHNIISGNRQHGIRLIQDHPGGHGNVAYNNVLSRNGVIYPGGAGIVVQDAGNDTLYNNIFSYNGVDLWLSETTGVRSDYNCYTDTTDNIWWVGNGYDDLAAFQVAGYETNGISANPLFSDTAAHNFHLSWGSPCVNVGDPATDSGFDMDGRVTPHGAFDLGAYESYLFNVRIPMIGVMQ